MSQDTHLLAGDRPHIGNVARGIRKGRSKLSASKGDMDIDDLSDYCVMRYL